MKISTLFLLCLLSWPVTALAVSVSETGAPPELAAWSDWVLFGQEEYFCPKFEHDNLGCVWPVTLKLELTDKGGSFEGVWEIKAQKKILLPGQSGAWPEKLVDLPLGASPLPIPVLGQSVPETILTKGRHVLKGTFVWNSFPETLQLPLGPILKITLNGQEMEFPAIDIDYSQGSARLWLKNQKPELDPEPQTVNPVVITPSENQMKVTVDRLITDSQPLTVSTRIKLTVSGQNREELLPDLLLPGSRPTYLTSPLPARLTPEGLRVQVIAGVHEIYLDTRQGSQVDSLGPVNGLYGPENWAFDQQSHLRLVEVTGASQIDATQVDIPWKNFPIYTLTEGQSLYFKTIRRGDPEPGPDQLNLSRRCWLDYNGVGLTCRDSLSGLMNRQWYLSVEKPFDLGQASLAGQPQVITWQKNSKGEKAPGLQLRQGKLNLSADLRIENFEGLLPASGWDHNLSATSQDLNLPPGYRLFYVNGAKATGPGGGPASWWDRWTTLDLFIVLVIILSTFKIIGKPWAILAAITMILTYHEFMAPRLVFLHILGSMALLKVLSAGKAKTLVNLWKSVSILALLLMSVTFIIYQARISMYPQLENVSKAYSGGFGYPVSAAFYHSDTSYNNNYYDYESLDNNMPMAPASEEFNEPLYETEENIVEAPKPMLKRQSKTGNDKIDSIAFSNFSQFKSFGTPAISLTKVPDAKVQNSLARPDWSWLTINLDYNGQVTKEQNVSLTLITPLVSRISGFLRIFLLAWFIAVVIGIKSNCSGRFLKKFLPQTLAILLFMGFFQTQAKADQFPSEDLLETLRERLLKLETVPQAGIPELTINVEEDKIVFEFTIEAAEETVIALPIIDDRIFHPVRIKTANDLPLLAQNGQKLVLVPKGINSLYYEGRLKNTSAFQIDFPQGTRPQRLIINKGPWEISGLGKNSTLSSRALYLSRPGFQEENEIDKEEPEETENIQPLSTNLILEPFFLVDRTLSLGLEWQVLTRVTRLSHTGAPATLRLPLLPFEHPTTEGFTAENGQMVLNFGQNVSQMTWISDLKMTENEPIVLSAQDGLYTESWTLTASSIWRIEMDGLTPVYQATQGQWNPQWRPWPGEKLTLTVTKPEPIPGIYQVVDRATLDITLGEQNRRNDLNFSIRTGQGGPHSLRLPPGSEILELRLDDRGLPTNGSTDESLGPLVTLPLNPGNHRIELSWLSPEPITVLTKSPALDLGLLTANIDIKISTPADRWTIFAGGPKQGPAVLFWSFSGALLVLAFGLSRLKITPLGLASWFLLFLGLSQLSLWAAFLVAGWLLVLGLRAKKLTIKSYFWFNLTQLGLVVWTIAALVLIYNGLQHGLLEAPGMSVTGNGSSDHYLNWFQDRAEVWPEAYVLSIPNKIYQYIMLAWALWLAISLISWLRWGWKCFSTVSLWKSSPKVPKVKNESKGTKTESALPKKE